MSRQRSQSRRIAVAKPKNDIYVALLAISLGALLIACLLLALEMNEYGWSTSATAGVFSPTPAYAVACEAPVAVESHWVALVDTTLQST